MHRHSAEAYVKQPQEDFGNDNVLRWHSLYVAGQNPRQVPKEANECLKIMPVISTRENYTNETASLLACLLTAMS